MKQIFYGREKAMRKFVIANKEAEKSRKSIRKTDVILLTEFFSGD